MFFAALQIQQRRCVKLKSVLMSDVNVVEAYFFLVGI